jgi:exosortase family protein XrtG
MTWALLQGLSVAYFAGLIYLHRLGWRLAVYIWGACGSAFLFIQLSLLQGWDKGLAIAEAEHVQRILTACGLSVQLLNNVILFVADPTGWTGLQIGIECSSLIELSIFSGLMLLYPGLSFRKRWTYWAIGASLTYALNLIRIMLIVVVIAVWGKPIVPLAHTVLGRLVYFAGVVALYWFLFTKPTLAHIHRAIETSGRAVE